MVSSWKMPFELRHPQVVWAVFFSEHGSPVLGLGAVQWPSGRLKRAPKAD
jgi:hypothetical protein